MTQEQLNAFLVKLEGNRSLQETIRTAKSTEEVVDAAKSAGFAFSANGLNQPSKITEEELEEASGGQFGSHCMCHHKTLCKTIRLTSESLDKREVPPRAGFFLGINACTFTIRCFQKIKTTEAASHAEHNCNRNC